MKVKTLHLKYTKVSIQELTIVIFLMVLSGFLYILPTTAYVDSKLLAVTIIAFFVFSPIKKYKIKGVYSNFVICFLAVVLLQAIYSMLAHSQMPTDVFNICGGYFAIAGYIYVMNLNISKEKIEKIFINFTKLIVIIFFIQYYIFRVSGRIVFIDFYHPQMRAGFLRAGVGSTFVSISVILLFSELLKLYQATRKIDIKSIIWIAVFSVYYVLFICVRADILAVFATCLILVFTGTNKRKLKVAFIILGILGTIIILQSPVFYKYTQIDRIEGGGSVTGRLEMYKYYFTGFLESPILGQGFLKPTTAELTKLLYGARGYFYLEDVGIVGFIFTLGMVGILTILYLFIITINSIRHQYHNKKLFESPEILGMFLYMIFTMPTLFLFDYARNGYLMFVLLFMTPKWEDNRIKRIEY